MSSSIYGPVSSWETDFDHADPEYNKNAPRLWSDLRAKCPIPHTDRYGGAWMPLTYELVHEIAYDVQHFTNEGIIVCSDRPIVPGPMGAAPPITSDPPFHAEARRLLLPPFSSKNVALLEEDIRAICRARLELFPTQRNGAFVIDVAKEYAKHIPFNVIIKMVGLPIKDRDLIFSFISNLMEEVNLTPEELAYNRNHLDDYLDIQIENHRQHPRNDLITHLINATMGGKPLDQQHIRGTVALMFIAGVDTTWSMIGSTLWHLASHPEDLAQLVREPRLMDTAIEEFLRAYAPVTIGRLVREDYKFHGHELRKDDWILLNYPAANRDPAAFEDAEEIRLDREVNRHAAFGLGIHRCIGSNLARLELRLAVEEFIQQFPKFELADPGAVAWSHGQVRGPRTLELRMLP